MKNVLHVLGHILLVAGNLLLLQLLLFGEISMNTPKGQATYFINIDDDSKTAIESDSFNQMFGASISDALEYGYMKYEFDTTEELQNSVSANSIGRGDFANELRSYNGYFDNGKTNFNFYITAGFPEGTQILNNLGINDTDDLILTQNIFDKSGFYLEFNSLNNEFRTNSRINENTFYKILESTGYSNASFIHFVAGINKDVGSIDDSYKEAIVLYNTYTDKMPLKLIGIVLCFFGFVCVTFILTFKEGFVVDKETGKKTLSLKYYDYSPIEIRIIILIALSLIFVTLFDYVRSFYVDLCKIYIERLPELILVSALFLLVISIFWSFFYYGFVRRVKGRVIWKTSLTKKLWDYLNRVFSELSKNKGSFFKSILLVAGIALLNILLLLGVFKSRFSWLFIVGLVISDIIVTIAVYKGYKERHVILDALRSIVNGNVKAKINISSMHGDNINHAEAVNNIGDAVIKAVETSMKDEKMKADLITNVSHDLKTPLTSIINYVDLLKKEKIDNETAKGYIAILDEKSQRLKQMTDDLVEASKISSGNLVLSMEKINLKELLVQATGEFIDRFEEKNLTFSGNGPDDAVYINADSRSIYRVIENLFTNIYKYALEGTRVYIDIARLNGDAILTIKNISANEINNVSVAELTERFIRGDESRATEGSGLGLSIAKSLTEAMGGTFNIALDGDLFKVIMSFKEIM